MSDSATPKPTPAAMPGPKPGPTPGEHPVALPQPKAHNPADFGRIDANGDVYVTDATAEGGERLIGSWQAGTAEEGLAHFGQRFIDLVTEVELLEARVTAHPHEASKILQAAATLRESLPTAAALGDIPALMSRLDSVIEHTYAAGERAQQEKEERRAAGIARKEELIAQVEDLAANATQWKSAGDAIASAWQEWQGIRGIDKKTDDALRKRFSRARETFNRRRGAHFAELDRERAAAKRRKEELIEQAEALQHSTDWAETARAYRDLMTQWKAAGRAQRDTDDKLWARFKAAQDTFFQARDEVNAQRDQEFAANAAAKDALLEQYDSMIDPASSPEKARAKLRELQEKWEEIGFVPRNQVREYEEKIAAVERRVADAEAEQWRRTDPELQARAAQFKAKVDELTAAAEAAQARGKTGQAEKLRQQAQQWQQWAQAAEQAVHGDD